MNRITTPLDRRVFDRIMYFKDCSCRLDATDCRALIQEVGNAITVLEDIETCAEALTCAWTPNTTWNTNTFAAIPVWSALTSWRNATWTLTTWQYELL